MCLQIVFTVDRATQTRTQPKGNKSNAPTLLLRFYTANKHTSHTHTPTHMLTNMCTMCWGRYCGGGGWCCRARSSLHSFYVLKEPTDTPVQPDPNVRADVPSLSLSLRLALSRIVSLCLPLFLLHSFFNICISSCFLSLSLSPLSHSCPAGFYYFWLVCCITKM